MKIKWSKIFFFVQGMFIGGMLAACHMGLSDWQSYVILVGNPILSACISNAYASEIGEE